MDDPIAQARREEAVADAVELLERFAQQLEGNGRLAPVVNEALALAALRRAHVCLGAQGLRELAGAAEAIAADVEAERLPMPPGGKA